MKRTTISFVVIATLFFVTAIYQRGVSSQSKPFTMGQILRALASINEAPENEKKGISAKVLKDVQERGVDFPLTKENETLLRNEKASNELIKAIKAKSPMFLDELEKIKFIPYRKGDKFGFVDENKKVLIPFVYDNVEPFFDGITKADNKLINKANRILYSISNSDYLQNVGEGVGFIKQPNSQDKSCKLIAVDIEGNTLFSKTFSKECSSVDYYDNFQNGLISINDGSSWQTIDKKGNTIYASKYSEGVLFFSEEKEGKKLYGLKNLSGQVIIPPAYENIKGFSNGLASFVDKESHKWGAIDKLGREVIPAVYDEAFWFTEGIANVQYKGLRLFIDKSEKGFIPTQPGYIEVDIAKIEKRTSEGFTVFRKAFSENSSVIFKYGFIDAQSNEVIPAIYSYAQPFNSGLARAVINKKLIFIDKTGKTAIDVATLKFRNFKKFDLRRFSEELSVATVKDEETDKSEFWLIDKFLNFGVHLNNPAITYIDYSGFDGFSDGLLAVYKADFSENKYSENFGFIDKLGNVVIPLIYNDVKPFENGLACVQNISGKWGVIDKSGKEVFPFKYESAENIAHGIFLFGIKKDDIGKYKYSFDDFNNNYILINVYNDELRTFDLNYSFFNSGVAKVWVREDETSLRNAKMGFIDKTGALVIPTKYSEGYLSEKGFFKVAKDGKEFYIDKNGVEYYEP